MQRIIKSFYLINPNLINIWIYMSRSKYEQCLPRLLKTTQEGQILVQEWATYTSLRASHSYPHSSHSGQPKDTPLRLPIFTQTHVLQHGFKGNATKVPIPNAYLSPYMPLFLQFELVFFCHHSPTSTPYSLYSS
jgi:hypothetical protein